MKYTILSFIPPAVLLLVIVAIASCQPAKAVCAPDHEGACEDNISVFVDPKRAATPDIVKVLAVALVVGSIFQGDGKDRPYNIVKLRPDHRALMVVIDIPFNRSK